MTRVLVVDDEPQVAHALTRALGRAGYDVVVAQDGEQAVELAVTTAPGLMVLDLTMPGMPGLEVIRRVRPWFTAPILVLSGVTEERQRVLALDAGADDFLQKPFGLDELHARLRALERRSPAPSAESAETFACEGLTVDLAARRVEVDGVEIRLTPTEWRLLHVLVSYPERLLTHRWILNEVWEGSYGDETRDALRAHVRSLRAKLGDSAHSPRFIRTESGAGYRWVAREVRSEESLVVGAKTAESSNGAQTSRALVHELNNALTAMRLAVQLLQSPTVTDAAAIRLDSLVRRVTELALELETRIPDDETGDLPCH